MSVLHEYSIFCETFSARGKFDATGQTVKEKTVTLVKTVVGMVKIPISPSTLAFVLPIPGALTPVCVPADRVTIFMAGRANRSSHYRVQLALKKEPQRLSPTSSWKMRKLRQCDSLLARQGLPLRMPVLSGYCYLKSPDLTSHRAFSLQGFCILLPEYIVFHCSQLLFVLPLLDIAVDRIILLLLSIVYLNPLSAQVVFPFLPAPLLCLHSCAYTLVPTP